MGPALKGRGIEDGHTTQGQLPAGESGASAVRPGNHGGGKPPLGPDILQSTPIFRLNKRGRIVMATKTALTSRVKQPLGDRVLIRRDEPADKTKSGIVLPKQVQDRNLESGVVKMMGPGRWSDEEGKLIPLEATTPVRVGDRVLYPRVSGFESSRDDLHEQELVLVHVSDLMAVLAKDD